MTEQNHNKTPQTKTADHDVLSDKKEFVDPAHKSSGKASHSVEEMGSGSGKGEVKGEKKRP